MAEKILQTRIQLKYDTLANWMKDSFILKPGEMAIATIEASGTAGSTGMTPPAVGIKIGDGSLKFSELPWIQAIAGDVPTWAKESDWATVKAAYNKAISDAIKNVTDGLNVPTKTEVRKVELITSITTQNGKITGYETTPIKTDNVFLADGTTTLTAKLTAVDGAITKAKEDAISAAAADATAKANAAQSAAISTAAADAENKADTAKSEAIATAKTETESQVGALKTKLLGTGAVYGTDTIASVKQAAADALAAANAASTAAGNASAKVDTEIKKLDYTDTADNTKFVSKVDEVDGKISVSRVNVTDVLGIADSYDKGTNKIATVATVTTAVNNVRDELLEDIGEITGAMRFRGTVTVEPTVTAPSVPSDGMGAFRAGDVVIHSVNSKEFIYNGTGWEELGTEGVYAIKTEVDSAIEGLDGRVDSLETDNTQNKKDIAALIEADKSFATKTELKNAVDPISIDVNALKTAVNTTLPQNIATAKSEAISEAKSYADGLVNALDVTDAQATGSGFVSSVTQTNGKITVAKTKIKVSDISDLSTTATSGAGDNAFALKGYVDTAKQNAIDTASSALNKAIGDLDSSVAATAESNNQVSVLTGITQTDGKLTAKTETKLAAIAKTGNVADLIQTDTILVFDCGNASTKLFN